MKIVAVKTARVVPHDSLFDILDAALPALQENTVLCITSKIISLCEGAIVHKADEPDKRALIERESQAYLPRQTDGPYQVALTITNSILVPTAGIDESNGDDIYILYPRDIMKSAASLWKYLRARHNIKNLGIVITDSTSKPLRRGVTGVSLGWCGFKPLYDYVGKPDCFGKPLRITKVNVTDALAVAAVFVMGEGNEQTPIALIHDAPKVEFQDHLPLQEEIDEVTITMENDLFAPILTRAPWIKNGVKNTK